MRCPHCQSENTKRHGKDRNKNQRYRCLDCKKTWIDAPPNPLGRMNLPMRQAIQCLKMLLEGMSIRSCERLTGVNRNTLCDLIVNVGERCNAFLKSKLRGLSVKNLEVDEVWSFVGCKERTKERMGYGEEMGDAYSFIGLERDTKLIVAYHVGKRSERDTHEFIRELRNVTVGRFQLSTDGFKPYCIAVPDAFGFHGIDYAQIIKTFKNPPKEDERRYSPPQIVEVKKSEFCGNPDPDLICTSFVERSNLSLRMTCRRWTRLTNAHSKKWRNHEAALALYIAFYNFVRVHTTLETTPAVKHGLAQKPWTLEELLAQAA